MSRYTAVRKCLVCRKPDAEATLIDGHTIDVCETCATNDFMKREAIRRAMEKETK